MMKKLAGWWFPLVLALALGGVSFWLDRVSQLETEEVSLSPHEPQYEIFGIRAQRFGADGAVAEQLTAERAWQFPARSDAYLAKPDIVFAPHSGGHYRVRAAQAHYVNDHARVMLSGGVVLVKPAADGSPAGRLETDTLSIDTATRTARTEDVVRYRYGASHGTAQGMVYDHAAGRLNLSSRIKAVIYDPQTDHP
ncbi:MAG: LPS export ABC transporter periplasmic protein LptC [Eikenella sp.]|nr:LPS export ABC transporter periplasmic protein LptC [Eikenella sp.]